MANFHSRSNSFPSQSHPAIECVEDYLRRLKSSEGASTSATSVCANLAGLRDLHQGINDLIQMPSFQQALSNEQGEHSINELVEGSLRLVDLCGFSREVACLTKESVQDLESSMRRNKVDTATAVDMNAYVASRKNMNKMINKCIKNLKNSNQNPTAIPERDCDQKAIGTMLKETESLGFSVLKSILMLLSGEKERSNQRKWSLLSKFSQISIGQDSCDEDLCSLNIHKSRKSMDNMTLNKLKQSEMSIQEIEEGLECLFRSLVKTRVSLLNVLSH